MSLFQQPKKHRIILFNYGGGLRGLIPAYIMTRIEEKTGLRMADMVDVFAGPSTGAILGAALNVPSPQDPTVPKFRARHLVRFYEREGGRIFPPDRFRELRGFVHDFNNRTMKIGQLNKLLRHGHYKPKHLSRCLYDLYGDINLSQTLKDMIIPVFNIEGNALHAAQEPGENENMPVHTRASLGESGGIALWFKNIRTGRNLHPCPDVRLHDVVMGSTAAPSFFPCHHFSAKDPSTGRDTSYAGIDGSIFDNPCITYHGALKQHLQPDETPVMILLGTGNIQRPYKKEQWNAFGGLGVVDPANDLPLINIMFYAPESALLDSFSDEMKDRLFAFNKSIIKTEGGPSTPSTAIDDASPENFAKMKLFAEEILEENAEQLDALCHLLVSNYEKKKKRSWLKILSH